MDKGISRVEMILPSKGNDFNQQESQMETNLTYIDDSEDHLPYNVLN